MKCSFVGHLGGGNYPCPWEAEENGLCPTHNGKSVKMEFAEDAKPLGWCHFVSKANTRCSRLAVVETPKGKFCEEHK